MTAPNALDPFDERLDDLITVLADAGYEPDDTGNDLAVAGHPTPVARVVWDDTLLRFYRVDPAGVVEWEVHVTAFVPLDVIDSIAQAVSQ